MATFEDIFSGRNLTRTVQNTKSGVVRRVPDQFFLPTDRHSGRSAEWLQVDGNRQLAEIVAYGSPAKRVGHQGVTQRSARMLHTFESQQFQAEKLLNLLSDSGERQRMGEQEVARQTKWFKDRIMNLVNASVQFMLLNGKLHFNEKGQLLPTASGAVVTVDAGIPAGQLNQLDILGDGAIIGASWATDTTDIIAHLYNVKYQMMALGGWEITTAYYGKNIPKYIAANTVAKEYIQRTPELAAQAYKQSNKVPDGFQELNWVPAGDLFYIDASGSVQKMLGDDEIAFTPDYGEDWWYHGHGSFAVPRGMVRMGADASDMLSDLEEVIGMFSYAAGQHNPPTVEQFAGHTFLPVLRATKAWCKADVTP